MIKNVVVVDFVDGLFVRSTAELSRGWPVVDRDRDDTRAVAKFKKRFMPMLPRDPQVRRHTSPSP